jgi:hypothetical protein
LAIGSGHVREHVPQFCHVIEKPMERASGMRDSLMKNLWPKAFIGSDNDCFSQQRRERLITPKLPALFEGLAVLPSSIWHCEDNNHLLVPNAGTGSANVLDCRMCARRWQSVGG